MVPPPIHTHQHHKHCIWKTFSFPVFYFFLWFWIYSLLNTYSVRIVFSILKNEFFPKSPPHLLIHLLCVCVFDLFWNLNDKNFFSVFFSVQSPHKHITKSDFFSPRWFSVPVDLNKARKNFFYWQNIIWWFFLSDNFFFIGPQRCTRWWRWWWWIDFFSRSNYYQKHMHSHTHTHK